MSSPLSRPHALLRAVALLVSALLVVSLAPEPSHAALAAPNLVRPQGETSASNPILEWQPVTGAKSYRVLVSTSSTFESFVYNVSTQSTRATPPSDLPQGQLHWRVAAVDASNATGAFAVSSFTKVRLSAPVQVGPADGDQLSFPTEPPTFSWEPVPGAKSYRLEVDDATDFIGAAVYTTASTSFTLTEPQTVGQPFHWRVQAISAVTQLNSAFSPTRQYRITWSTAPTLLAPTAAAGSVEDVVLRWTAVPGAATYEVQVSPNGDWSNNIVHSATVKSTQYSPPDGLKNSSYYWRVRARDAGRPTNVGPWSAEPQFTRSWDGEGRRPELTKPAHGSQVSVPTLEWKPVELASHYELNIGTDVNFSPGTYGVCYTNHTTWTPYARLAPTSGHGEPGTCTPVSTSSLRLNPGTTYHWRVRGIDGNRLHASNHILGVWSNVGTSDTRSFTYRPDIPQLLGPLGGEAVDAPVLRWNHIQGHGKYRVTIIKSTGGTPITADTYATTYSPTTALKASDGPFYWYVQTIDANGKLGLLPDSSSRGRFDLKDPASTSNVPQPITPASGATVLDSPSMTWTPVTDAGFYRIYLGVAGTGVVRTLSGTTKVPYAAYTYPGTTSETSLAPGDYEWYVEAFTSAGVPISSGAVGRFTVRALEFQGLEAPANCPVGSPCPAEADTPTLSWKPVPGAGGYIVYVATDANFTNEYRRYWTIYPTLTPRESYLDNQAGQSYYWYVRPCWQGQLSPCGPFNTEQHHEAWTFRKESHGVAPLSPADGATVANQPTFTWQRYLATNGAAARAVTQEASRYRIQVATTGTFSPGTVVDEKVVEQTTFTPYDRTYPEGPLHWRVQAIDASGNNLTWSAPQALHKISGSPRLAAPRDGATVSGVPALHWSAEAFAAAYDVEVYRNGDLNFSTGNRVVSKQTKMTAYTPETSLGGGVYAWRVRRRDADGREGPWSAGQRFTIRAGEAALLSPGAAAQVPGGLPLYQWRPVAEAVSYQLEVSKSADFSTLVEKQKTAMTAWAPLKVYAEGTFHWRVRVLDAGGNVLSTSTVQSFTVTAGAPAPTPSAAGTSRRLADSGDPVTAAAGLSRSIFAAGSATRVLVGRDDVFADSLAGAALAGQDGPILYTTGGPTAALRSETRTEIARVLGSAKGCGQGPEVYLLGGTEAVSPAAEQAIAGMGYCVKRYSGASRVETSVAIAKDVVARSGSRQVLVARSHEWADAATGGAYAAASGAPVVVTLTGQLHPAVASFLGAHKPTDIVVLGGTGAISADVETQLRKHGPTRRISGAARDVTAIAIAEKLWPGYQPRGVVLVNGFHRNGWAYALAAAVPAAREGAVQLYVQPDAMSSSTEGYLDRTTYRFTVAAGPRSMISDAVHQQVIGGQSAP